MEKASPWPRAWHRSIPLLLVTLFLTLSVGALRVAAANQVILDWETDAAGTVLVPGQVIDDEFHSTQGISITISGTSNRPGGANLRAIFPSSVLPIDGNGKAVDEDLGSANETCAGGGPGKGSGGEINALGVNCVALGNVLILPTSGDGDGDGVIDDTPNDDAAGGLGLFLFSEPVTIDYLELLDMESPEAVTIRTYTSAAGSPAVPSLETNPAPLGDNSFQRVELNASDVLRLEVEYEASGALATLAYTPAGPTATTLLSTAAVPATASLWLFLALAFLLAVASALLVRRGGNRV